jgi:hypothetical protein
LGLAASLFEASLSARSYALLLPFCDFILKPSDSARSERDRRRKCARGDTLVNRGTFPACKLLDLWQTKNASQPALMANLARSQFAVAVGLRNLASRHGWLRNAPRCFAADGSHPLRRRAARVT